MKKILTTISILAATTFSGIATSHAESTFSKEQKMEIEGMITEYITQNPDVIMNSLENFRVKELERLEQEAQEKAANLTKDFKDSDAHPSAGNKDGDIVVIEFFDYNCGYCKKALTAIQDLTKKNDDVKVVFIELPILGESSTLFAKWSLAAHEQGNYFEFHQEIMDHRGAKTEAEIVKLAEKVGLDTKKLKEDSESEKVTAALDANRELAQSIGVSGTPGFIIGDQVVKGYIPYEQMEEIITQIREENKADKEN